MVRRSGSICGVCGRHGTKSACDIVWLCRGHDGKGCSLERAGDKGCVHICGPKYGMSFASRGRVCRSEGVCGRRDRNRCVPIYGLFSLCKVRTGLTTIRMLDDTVSVLRFHPAMLGSVKYSTITKLRSERVRSRCTFHGPCSRLYLRSGRQGNWDWSAGLARYLLQRTNWNKRGNRILLLDPALAVGTCNSE